MTTENPELPSKNIQGAVVSFVSGGIAGITAKTAISPLDRIKIIWQVGRTYNSRGVFRTLHEIATREGMRGMLKGNTATITRVFPYAAVQFMTYEQVKKVMKNHNEGRVLSPLQHLCAGSLAGAVSTIVTYPLDLVRARLAVESVNSSFKSKGIVNALASIPKTSGWMGFYSGLTPTLMGIIPYAGINFSVFETLKRYFSENSSNGEIPVTTKLFCGGFAGAVGQTVAYPFDVVRRRMQTSGHSGLPQINLKQGTFRALAHIVKTEGVEAVYKGLSLNYYKVVPTVGISFVVYEFVQSKLNYGFDYFR